MRKPAQQNFFKSIPKHFGGSSLKSNPKGKRTFSSKKPIHLILKSKHASHDWSFFYKSNKAAIDNCIRKQAKLNGVRIYGLQIMWNHIHLNLLFPSRLAYNRFIRSISGLISRIVMGCERGRQAIINKFWEARPYTVIVSCGRQWSNLKNYFKLNQLEAFGFSRPYARMLLESSG